MSIEELVDINVDELLHVAMYKNSDNVGYLLLKHGVDNNQAL